MDELDICYICNNPEIEPSVCLDCYHKNYLKGRREGAIAEIEKELTNLNIELKKYERQIRLADLSIKQYAKGLRDKTLGLIVDYEKRLKELQGGLK